MESRAARIQYILLFVTALPSTTLPLHDSVLGSDHDNSIEKTLRTKPDLFSLLDLGKNLPPWTRYVVLIVQIHLSKLKCERQTLPKKVPQKSFWVHLEE